jgi:hypothetical protein
MHDKTIANQFPAKLLGKTHPKSPTASNSMKGFSSRQTTQDTRIYPAGQRGTSVPAFQHEPDSTRVGPEFQCHQYVPTTCLFQCTVKHVRHQ